MEEETLQKVVETAQGVSDPPTSLEPAQHYLSVKEVARIMKVSERSVYSYIADGKLPALRVDNVTVVAEEHVANYQRRAPGRLRTTVPVWHMPPAQNRQYLTFIIVRVRPGKGELLEGRLAEIRAENRHLLPGTAARYIGSGRYDPDSVQIVLTWRSAVMPAEEERAAALAEFYADLADILDWETMLLEESRVLMHA